LAVLARSNKSLASDAASFIVQHKGIDLSRRRNVLGIQFRRSLRIAPGIRLNLSRSGISTSIGQRGASVTLSRRGTYANVGLPGTGLSWRGRINGGKGRRGKSAGRVVAPSEPNPTVKTAQAETTGQTALHAALVKAHLRRPFTDALAVSVADPDAPLSQDNLLFEGQIGRRRFLGSVLILLGLIFSLVWLQDAFPRNVSEDVFFMGALVIGAVASAAIALRSRAAGVAPWVTFLGIGLAAYLAPWGLALILGALMLVPGREKAAP
jgi:uncharacterized membrane protein YhaH (DUF805 family)